MLELWHAYRKYCTIVAGERMAGQQSRIRFLDGLRGLAIFLVLGFHYTGPTYAAKLPYGNSLAWIPVLDHGWIGVYLFFLISGYVIFMTLEKCATAGDFFQRRWLRLFPAMLFASIVIFAFSQLFGSLVQVRHRRGREPRSRWLDNY
jgi:peptidoglycan/LPS O-acetylase OafA/YrhL